MGQPLYRCPSLVTIPETDWVSPAKPIFSFKHLKITQLRNKNLPKMR